MYVLSLLVIGRSLMVYKSWFLLKNIFCRSCLQSGGACFSTAKAEVSACPQGEHSPLPLMSKGESDLVWWLPSSPKGEIVGILAQVWRYDTGVVLDGNSLW